MLSLVLATLIALVYFVGARLGWSLTLEPGVPLLWPPGALLFAALLLAPIGFWKVLLAPLFIAHLAARAGGATPAVAALEFGGLFTALMIGAAALRHALGGAPRFESLRDTGLFLLCALLTAALAALPLAAAFPAPAAGRDWLVSWRVLFHAQALALLVLTPAIVGGARALRHWFDKSFAIALAREHWLEGGALLLACAAGLALWFGAAFDAGSAPVLACVWLGLSLWAALRFSPLLVALLLVTATATVGWTLRADGEFFPSASPAGALPLSQWFLSALAATALLCAALSRERERAVEQGRDQDKLLGLALHAAPMSSWAWDLGTRTIAMKTAASDVFQRHLFAQCLTHIHDEDRREVEQALAAAVERGEPYEVEFRLCQPDGGTRCIRSRGAPQLDASGRPARVLGITVDVSERRRREQQIREQRRELAQLGRVAMLGELSGAIAHELNQPLTTVLGNAQAAQQLLECESPDLAEIRAILADIVAENQRAGEIIRRLRSLLKKGEIAPQELNVNELVLEVIGLEHGDLVARDVFVSTELAENLPPVRADRVQIQQVLLNLMTNAGDAMARNETGERLIRIGTCCENGFVQILVSDSGSGLPALQPERIFEAFFTTKEQGLGLGLTICRSIVDAHGGELHARDTGRGAVFTLALPSAEVREVAS